MKPDPKPESKNEIELNKNKLKSNKGPYVLGEKLGEGAFAKVRLATQIHIKEKCAVKILEKKLLESSRDIQRLKKEIKILKKLRHKNIIQLYDIMESKRNLYFVMEYCKNGELFDYIVSKKRLKENEACCFFQQIINGVDYLHKQGIIHRDLKPENLLLDDKYHIKISDFGLSTFFSKNNYLQTACGTPSYAPPEMLEGHEYNGEATDVWSCGIILYAMLCGTLPFSESQEEIIVKKIKMHDYTIPNYLSKDAKDLLNHILIINPKERYNIKQIINHPWFNLIKPHMVPGINIDEDIIPVDDKILEKVKNYGFDPLECKELLLKNKFCSLTTIYYLCLKKFVRENGKSISDLESDLFEQYIKSPKNKRKKEKIKEENESTDFTTDNYKTERNNNSHIYNIRLPTKKENLNSNSNKTENKNNNINTNDKRNGTPILNCIKISANQRNLKSTKNIKNGCALTDNNVNSNNKSKINSNNKTTSKENDIKDNNNKDDKKNYRNINKNKSPAKNTAKTIHINKTNLIKNQIHEKEVVKNTSTRKNKLKIINTNNKNQKNQTSDKKPKITKNETERKPLTNKFILPEEINTKENSNNNPINTNVNIINININNTQPNMPNKENNFTDKEFSMLLKQKLDEINQIKAQNDLLKEKKINEINNNLNLNLRDDEDELKALLNSLNLKEINSSITNQNNTYSSIYNNSNNNNSNLFSSIFQDSGLNNQTKTFIDVPKNYTINNPGNTPINNLNNSRPKSSLYQYLGNDMEKFMLLKGERPINVINYIAKKLVATSFCSSFNFQNGYNSSIINNTSNNNLFNSNINQTSSFYKKLSEDNNSLRKSNGNSGGANENSFENNSIIKDSSLFVNDENDDKDLNFKNLVSILNKKFKSYLSKEKLNKTEFINKNNNDEYDNKIKENNDALNIKENINKNSFINEIKKEGNNNSLYKSFNFQKTNNDNDNIINKKNDNSYIILSYSKKDKSIKDNKVNQTSLKYNKNINSKNKTNLKDSSSYIHSSKINNFVPHHNTFLDISTNYEPNMDSRNSSVERSISFKKKELRNLSCSPSHENKTKNKNSNKKGQIINITKKNKNFNTISEDDEFKESEKKKINSNNNKKRKKVQICQNKVTINLSLNEDNGNINNKKGNFKLKKIITKKK